LIPGQTRICQPSPGTVKIALTTRAPLPMFRAPAVKISVPGSGPSAAFRNYICVLGSAVMGTRTGEFRGIVAAIVLAAALLLPASGANASDTFVLKNQSSSALLQGLSLWGKGNTMAAECRTGPFPGATETGFTFNPGNTGSITLTQDPFSDCLPGINPLVENSIQGPGFTGAWVWIPVDPLVGDAHLTCTLLAQTGPNYLQSSVDGLTCTVTDVGNSTSGTFGSSVAPLRGGKAVAYVQHFPDSKGRQSRADYTVVMRTAKGAFLGKEKVTVKAGKPQRVRVPVTKAIRKLVKKNGFARVKATMKRADGKRGSGDRATLTVTRDSNKVPF